MNTTVTSRPNAASKAALLPLGGDKTTTNTFRTTKQQQQQQQRKGNKGKKKSILPLIVGGICFVQLMAFLVLISRRGYGGGDSKGTSASSEYQEVNNKSFDNPYEGWQPAIHWDKDKTDDGCNSWRACLSKKDKCHTKCRDSLKEFGTAPPRPGFTPDPDLDDAENLVNAQAVQWVPDVTVLRRMLEAGKDQDGNPWPPPLVTATDRELCEPIGNFGGNNDEHMTLLNAVPIRGMPLLGNEEWMDAAFASKKMGRQPKVMCLVYTMEANHHTNIRVIRETWGPGCDGFLAFSTKDDPRIPAISIPHDGPEEYGNMVGSAIVMNPGWVGLGWVREMFLRALFYFMLFLCQKNTLTHTFISLFSFLPRQSTMTKQINK